MTTSEIISACIGFILCALIFIAIAIVVFGIICWLFKLDFDLEDDINYMEDPDND